MSDRPPMSEREWQTLVVDAAHLHGWWVHHHHDSRRSSAGWPDLILLRPPELIIVELKSERGRLTREQKITLERLCDCGIETHVWRPADEAQMLARLARRGGRRAAAAPRQRSTDADTTISLAACQPSTPFGCTCEWGPRHVCDLVESHGGPHRCACGETTP